MRRLEVDINRNPTRGLSNDKQKVVCLLILDMDIHFHHLETFWGAHIPGWVQRRKRG